MAISREDVLEYISNLSVLGLSEPVKELEEKFGVSATPVMAAGGAAAGGGAAAAEERTGSDVVLTDSGAKKVEVIKIVCALIGLGLREAKDAVEQTSSTLKEDVAKADVEEVKRQFEEAGAKVELK